MTVQRQKRERGQGLTEFALVLVLFLLIIMVIFDISRAVFFYTVVHNAVREGARYGVTDPVAANIQNEMQNLAAGLDLVTNVSVTTTTVTVNASFTFEPATPFLGLLTGSPNITLSSRATMEREQ